MYTHHNTHIHTLYIIYIFTHPHTNICTYIHTYVHTYIHTYIHTCIHTHIHTHCPVPYADMYTTILLYTSCIFKHTPPFLQKNFQRQKMMTRRRTCLWKTHSHMHMCSQLPLHPACQLLPETLRLLHAILLIPARFLRVTLQALPAPRLL